jgi:uncharacterized membrane protein YkvA (DUF1232 family)
MNMNNPYFRLALNRASSFLGNRGRLLLLAIQLTSKARNVNFSKSALKEKLFLMGRLLKAFATGRYRMISVRSILLVIAAVIYFMNPLDLIPDAIIGLGFTDDFAILTGVYKLIGNELEKFSAWEDSTAALNN